LILQSLADTVLSHVQCVEIDFRRACIHGANASPYVERLIGSIRRECLDHVVILNEISLRRHLVSYLDYYHGTRSRLSLRKDSPDAKAIQVTGDTAMDWNPVWSPDGHYLYFSSNRGGSMNLWRVPIEEQSGRVLGTYEPVTTPSPYSGYLSFSRDGTLLAYADRISISKLQRVEFDADNGKCVGQPVPMPGLAEASFPASSADGSRLAFVSGRNQDDIFVVRADGTELRQLTDDTYREIGPSWSPDGKLNTFFLLPKRALSSLDYKRRWQRPQAGDRGGR